MRNAGWGLVVLVLTAPVTVLAQTKPPKAPSEPQLQVAYSDDGRVELTRSEAAFDHTFTIVAMNALPVGDLTVYVGPFQDDRGRHAPVTVEASSRTITLETPVTVRVRAELAEPGRWFTDLDLVYAKKRTTTRVVVHREPPLAPDLPPPGVEPVGTLSVRAEGSDPVSIVLKLRALEGRPRELSQPEIASLERSGDDGERVQAEAEARVAGLGDADPVKVPARGEARLTVELRGLDEPGRYDGVLRLDAAGAQPLEVPFHVTRKDAWWIAVLFIAAGVVASHLLKHYFRRWRRRLVWRRDLARLRDRLPQAARSGSSDEREREVVAAVRAQLDDLAQDVAYDVVRDVETAMTELARRVDVLEEWARLRRQVAALGGAKGASELQGALDEAADVLGSRAATAAELEDASRDLRKLEVRQTMRAAIDGAIAQLREQVEAARRAASEITRAALSAEVDPALDRARERFLAEDLAGAEEVLDRARRAYVNLLAAAIRDALDPSRKPADVDAGSWRSLAAEVGALLDQATSAAEAEAAVDKYQQAQALYLDGLARRLGDAASRKVDEVRASDRPEEDRERIGDDLERVREDLDRAAKLSASDARAATRVLAEASRRYSAVQKLLRADGPPPFVPPPAPPAPARSAERRPPREKRSADTLQTKLRSYDWAVTAAILLIATVSGLQLLWAGSATWGSLESRLLAFLWGLGLHQVGHVPFEGLVGLRERFERPD